MCLCIDLNADVGESTGADEDEAIAGILRSVTSVSVAAGFHGGNPSMMRATIRLAAAAGVSIGAHPGFPDLAGLGRREMHLPPGEVEDLVLYQIAAVAGVAAAEGATLGHVKPHGALYNMAATDRGLAAAIVRACVACDRSLVLFAPPNSELLAAGRESGLQTAVEGFADRAYAQDGALVSRSAPGAVLHNTELVVSRAVQMVKEGTVAAVDGSILPMRIDTLCVHGDTPDAARLAAAIRAGLEAAGISVAPLAS